MLCPFCTTADTKVIDSRLVDETNQVRRRRECLNCEERFNTFETAEIDLPSIVKRDQRRVSFDEDKLHRGLVKAFEKRPVGSEKIDEIIAHVKRELRNCGEAEVQSGMIGKWVMDELKNIDLVAYVRFASVYLDFKDLTDFKNEIDTLLAKK
jgi:transcriptional repressor NrdR